MDQPLKLPIAEMEKKAGDAAALLEALSNALNRTQLPANLTGEIFLSHYDAFKSVTAVRLIPSSKGRCEDGPDSVGALLRRRRPSSTVIRVENSDGAGDFRTSLGQQVAARLGAIRGAYDRDWRRAAFEQSSHVGSIDPPARWIAARFSAGCKSVSIKNPAEAMP